MNIKKIILAIGLAIGLAIPCFAQSGRLDSLLVRTELLWGTTVASDNRLDTADFYQAINLSCEELALSQLVDIVKQDTIALSAGTKNYSLNANCTKVLAVRYLSAPKDTLLFSLVNIKDLGRKYESKLNLPLQGAQVNKTLSVYRTPLQTDSLLVYYLASANLLDGASDSTDIPIEYRWLIPVLSLKYLSIATGEMTAQQGIEYSLKYGVKPKSYDIVVQPEVVK